jgi:hypothetical protein
MVLVCVQEKPVLPFPYLMSVDSPLENTDNPLEALQALVPRSCQVPAFAAACLMGFLNEFWGTTDERCLVRVLNIVHGSAGYPIWLREHHRWTEH